MSARRTAVVLVHGIGEQRPMATLRHFVRAYAGRREEHTRVWSVPDRCDMSFELHTYVVPAEQGPGGLPQVDFYEGYWAPSLRGTRMAHVVRWARRLVLRTPGSLPVRVRWLWWVMVAALAGALAMVAWIVPSWGDHPWFAQVAKGLAAVALPALAALLTSSIGDAARYLDNHPDNVAARTAVRGAVVSLLDALHQSKRYGRVVVVGHSLGGVVAYDALRLLWARRLRDFDVTAVDDTRAARLAKDVREGAGDLVPELHQQQTELFGVLSEMKRDDGSAAWLVSDFLSVGAPLAFPALLLATPGTDLETLVEERELPTCPPQLANEDDVPTAGRLVKRSLATQAEPPTFRYVSGATDERPEDIRVFHHGAMFAVTRWTNVYAAGDFIGGEIDPLVGAAVTDVRLGRETGRWTLVPFTSHTRYWSERSGADRIGRILDQAVSR